MWIWWAVARGATCDSYGDPSLVAEIDGPILQASGLAASRTREGTFFTHGDRGEPPMLAAFDEQGALRSTHTIKNADNEDWEDLVAAPCPDEGDCLYIGDIGDNDLTRAGITVYAVREPEEGDETIPVIARWSASYPDGPRDAETLLVHPCTGEISLVTKSTDGESEIYRFPSEEGSMPEESSVLERVAELSIEGSTAAAREITGGAWDTDGERVALRTGDRVLEWTTDPSAPDAHWQQPPVVYTGAVESQGEALTYGLDGDLYGVGEGSPTPLARWVCDAYEPSDAQCAFPQTGRRCGCAEAGGRGSLPLSLSLLSLLVWQRSRR